MNDTLEALLFLLRLPYLLLARALRPSNPPSPPRVRTDAARQRIEANEPPPLPDPRPRRLSLDEGNGACDMRGAQQQQEEGASTPLFFNLPREVRDMVYREVLGGRRLHVVRKRRRLGFRACRVEAGRGGECPTRECLGSVDAEGVWTGGFSGRERTDGGVLGLVLVCRRVYVFLFFRVCLSICLSVYPLALSSSGHVRDTTPKGKS